MRILALTLCAVFAFAYALWAKDLAMLEKDLADLEARVKAIENHIAADPNKEPPVKISMEEVNLSDLAKEGKTKFNIICTACHKETFTDPMLAPPMAMVKDHYSRLFKNDKEGFVQAVVEWVKAPQQEKTLMPGAIRNFKIMPALPLPDEDLRAIATYLYEADIPFPTNFEEHIRQERRHMQQGAN